MNVTVSLQRKEAALRAVSVLVCAAAISSRGRRQCNTCSLHASTLTLMYVVAWIGKAGDQAQLQCIQQ